MYNRLQNTNLCNMYHKAGTGLILQLGRHNNLYSLYYIHNNITRKLIYDEASFLIPNN